MKKLMISGMSCMHCVGRVEKALKGLDGVTTVDINLEEGSAVVHMSSHLSDALLKATVEEVGYEVTGINQA